MQKSRIRTHLVFLSVLTFLASGAYAGQTGYKGYPRGNALISVQELKSMIDARDPKLVILAAENDLEYFSGHIPDARQVDRPAYASPADARDGVEENILDAAGFTRLVQRLGIDRDSKVIVYDDRYDATRLWWAFTYYGKSDVRVVDGGIQSWKAAGYPVHYLPAEAPDRSGNMVARVALPRLRVDTPEIQALPGNPSAQLWDTRGVKEFSGQEQKKGAYRAGRIPGSRHCEWTHFKTRGNHAEWVTAPEMDLLLREFGYDPKKEQYFYCQSGVRSTQALFALYLSGWPLEKLHNYDSSWIGWSKNAALPLEVGLPGHGASAQANR